MSRYFSASQTRIVDAPSTEGCTESFAGIELQPQEKTIDATKTARRLELLGAANGILVVSVVVGNYDGPTGAIHDPAETISVSIY